MPFLDSQLGEGVSDNRFSGVGLITSNDNEDYVNQVLVPPSKLGVYSAG